jgi:hypothetical protein
MQRHIKFQCAGVWIPAGLACVYTYISPYITNSGLSKISLEPELPKSNYCVVGDSSLIVDIHQNFFNLLLLLIYYNPTLKLL